MREFLIPWTVNAALTNPAEKSSGCPRPARPGLTALRSPIGMFTTPLFSLTYPNVASKREPCLVTQVAKMPSGRGGGRGSGPVGGGSGASGHFVSNADVACAEIVPTQATVQVRSASAGMPVTVTACSLRPGVNSVG